MRTQTGWDQILDNSITIDDLDINLKTQISSWGWLPLRVITWTYLIWSLNQLAIFGMIELDWELQVDWELILEI